MTTLDSLLPQNNCDVRTINNLSEGIKRALEIEIQLQILQTLQGIQEKLQEGGGGGAPDFINTPGPPTVNPPALQNIVVDSNGRQWQYFNGGWN